MEFLQLVVAEPGPAAWEAIRANLTAAQVGRFPMLFTEAAKVMAEGGAEVPALDAIANVLVGRCGEMMGPQLAQTAPGLAALAGGGSDVAAAVEALATRVRSGGITELSDWTAMAQAVSTALPSSEVQMVDAVAQRSRALGGIDLARVTWLLDHGAERTGVRDTVVQEILSGRGTPTELAAALDAIRGKMQSSWQVREALVIRVIRVGTGQDPRPLLEAAKRWSRVPKTLRKDYDPALDTILAWGGLDDLVADLRA